MFRINEATYNDEMDELPIVCDRSGLTSSEPGRQRELWAALVADAEEKRELEEGYSLKLPVGRLGDAAELMDIEKRCCGFLDLRLDARASESHIWFTLSGPPGTKRVLDAELSIMLESNPRSP